MKKRHTPITKAFASCDDSIARQLESNLCDEDALDARCEKFPPCVICKRGGLLKRIPYVPVDIKNDMDSRGYTMAITLCHKCKAALIVEDKCMKQISMLKDLSR